MVCTLILTKLCIHRDMCRNHILMYIYMNRGKAGAEDEIEDSGFNLTSKQLYHPNSSAQALKEFRTKFEDNEDEIEAFERR